MATPAYIKIEGKTQGLISAGATTAESIGNVYQEKFKDQILVQKIEHEVIIPTDPQSGQPTGERIHSPYKIVFSTNKSKPLLLSAICNGELLPKVEIEHYRPTTASGAEHYYTTVLEDAVIVKMKTEQAHAQDPNSSHLTQQVELWLSYRKITETHEVCGTEGSDDWRETAV